MNDGAVKGSLVLGHRSHEEERKRAGVSITKAAMDAINTLSSTQSNGRGGTTVRYSQHSRLRLHMRHIRRVNARCVRGDQSAEDAPS